MRIAVMAGTPIDTKLGNELLHKKGFNDNFEIAVSKNPVEQTIFQVSKQEEKNRVIQSYIDKIKELNVNVLFVYCNSLSSAVDFDYLATKNNINIITPMQMYKKIAKKYKKIAVLSANSIGLQGVEKNLYIGNKELDIFGVSFLKLVKLIEEGVNEEKIYEILNLKYLINYFEVENFEAIVLGCTHFPYIKNTLTLETKLEIIDVGKYMIKEVVKLDI